jgi:hypothetical protein
MRYTTTKWRQQQSNRFRHASISFLLLFCLSSPPTTMIYRKCASIVVSVYIWYLLFIINYYLYLKVSVTWHAMIPAIRQSFSIQLPIYQRLTRTALDALCVSPCVLLSIASRKSTFSTFFTYLSVCDFNSYDLQIRRMVPRKIPYIPKRGVALGADVNRRLAVAPSQDF